MAVKGNKFLNVALSVTLVIIGLVVLFSFVAGTWSSLSTSLTNFQNYSGYCITNATDTYCGDDYADGGTLPTLPFRGLVSPSGIITLAVMAVLVIGVIVGTFALLKKQKR